MSDSVAASVAASSASGAEYAAQTAAIWIDEVNNKVNVLLDAGSKHWEKTVQIEAKVDELTLKVDRLLALLESKNKSICR